MTDIEEFRASFRRYRLWTGWGGFAVGATLPLMPLAFVLGVGLGLVLAVYLGTLVLWMAKVFLLERMAKRARTGFWHRMIDFNTARVAGPMMAGFVLGMGGFAALFASQGTSRGNQASFFMFLPIGLGIPVWLLGFWYQRKYYGGILARYVDFPKEQVLSHIRKGVSEGLRYEDRGHLAGALRGNLLIDARGGLKILARHAAQRTTCLWKLTAPGTSEEVERAVDEILESLDRNAKSA